MLFTKIDENKDKYYLQTKCETCQSLIVMNKTKTKISCMNYFCPDKVVYRTMKMLNQKGINIKEEYIKQLVQKDGLVSPLQLFTKDNSDEKLKELLKSKGNLDIVELLTFLYIPKINYEDSLKIVNNLKLNKSLNILELSSEDINKALELNNENIKGYYFSNFINEQKEFLKEVFKNLEVDVVTIYKKKKVNDYENR